MTAKQNKNTLDYADRQEVKELAERIILLIPDMANLGAYKEQAAVALAQASITSGLNPFLGEIWALPKGKSGEECTGFSIKPGIKGARRAARNQAAEWGLVPPYYRPIFRQPTEWESKLIGGAQAAVACDLELVLPVDHPWYRDAGGARFIITGLGAFKGGGSRMDPFQAARKRAEEDALKLAFDLPVYGDDADAPDPEPEAPAPSRRGNYQPDDQENGRRLRETLQGQTPAVNPLDPFDDAGRFVSEDPVTPVNGVAGRLGPMPDFSNCGPNYWNNLTSELEEKGLIPSRSWLVERFRIMGIKEVNENNAQFLVNKALERFGDLNPVPEPGGKEEKPEEKEPEAPAPAGVDPQTGELDTPARPLSADGVVALVQAHLQKAMSKYKPDEKQTDAQTGLYYSAVKDMGLDYKGETALLFQLLFAKRPEILTRAEMSAYLTWCLDPEPDAEGIYHLNEWAKAEAAAIINRHEEIVAEASADEKAEDPEHD